MSYAYNKLNITRLSQEKNIANPYTVVDLLKKIQIYCLMTMTGKCHGRYPFEMGRGSWSIYLH
jgi:fructose/tagatose bisphosphate aldolase